MLYQLSYFRKKKRLKIYDSSYLLRYSPASEWEEMDSNHRR